MNIFRKLVYQYMAIFVIFSPTLSILLPLQVRLVVDEDDNGKFRLESVTTIKVELYSIFEMQTY